jgi:protein TonB
MASRPTASPVHNRAGGAAAVYAAYLRRQVPFGSAWQWPRENALDSLAVLLKGPAPPKRWPVGPFFHDAWIRGRANRRTLVLSVLWHAVVLIFPLHTWVLNPRTEQAEPKRLEVSWMGSSRILLPYVPPKRAGRHAAHSRSHQRPARGAEALNPQQTIISDPAVVTHPRQTLIQPAAPPEPPKILTPLPDVVQWPDLEKRVPVRPKLRVNPAAKMRQQLKRPEPPVAAPEVHAAPAELHFASTQPEVPRPQLEVSAGARPTFAAEKLHDQEAAPEVGAAPTADLSGQKLVALSTNPAPPPPNLEVPQGNLAAKFTASPEGPHPGAPGGVAGTAGGAASGSGSGTARNGSGPGGGGKNGGIPGVAVLGGNVKNGSNIAGPGGTPGPGAGGSGLPLYRQPLAMRRAPQPGVAAPHESDVTRPQESLQERIKAAARPEDLLEPGRVYTLHVSMPNLSSVMGSWTLKFVELDEQGKEIAGTGNLPDVTGPVPLRKVDPKYPPALAKAKVEGDVVLYAIIRRDGSVDSIEVVRSVDPTLDQNAMEALARWKFRAAQREGHAVELAALVRIPFRSTASLF